MELIYLNANLDVTKEHELFNITPQGFRVEIEYTDESWRAVQGLKKQVLENCTEVHHLFDSPFEKEIAFESDIRAEGCTRKISELAKVTITLMEF